MNKLLLACGSAAFLCLFAFTVPPKALAGPGAIEDMLSGLLQAIDRGDHAAVKQCFATGDTRFPVLVWGLDLENKPVTAAGAEAAARCCDGLLDAVAKANGTIASKVTDIHADCHSAELGYATMDLEQTRTVGGKSETSHVRATVLVSMDKQNQWQVFHWHASLVPAAQPAAK